MLFKLVLVIAIILLIPMICRKLHIPGLVGLILAGVALGPHGIAWINGGETIQMLGKMGLLYIMFQAGVEIDHNDFQQVKYKAWGFGLMSFIFPFVLGLGTSMLLGYSLSTSILLGAMYGSHTLMTYPIVSRYGVQKSSAVNITVGGTIITITLALVMLAMLEGVKYDLSPLDTVLALGKVILSVVIILLVLPMLTQRFFKRWQDPAENFLWVMLLMVISALLCEWAGLDGILGAFLCGVALNRFIPNRSTLMSRINFVGSTIFVPMFLLGVGIIIDTKVLFSSPHIYLVAAVMMMTKLGGKWLAAALAGRVFHLSGDERQLIFGLTHATAAGTLAIVTIGYEMGLFDAEILNSAVIMILVLCTLSGFVTERAAKQLALRESASLESERDRDEWLMMSVGENIHASLKTLAQLSNLVESEFVQCPDWQQANALVERTSKSTVIYHEVQPLNTISRLLVVVPRNAEKERDFISCFGQIRRLSSQLGASVIFFANDDTKIALRALCHRKGKYLQPTYRDMYDWEDVLLTAKELRENDLVVFVSARAATPSYNPLFTRLPHLIEKFFSTHSYIIIYPEQTVGDTIADTLLMEAPYNSRTWQLIERVENFFWRQLRKHQHK